tara:strand:+ start:5149 stop:6015 length:867 start_codon:yes stop_codon:yes gene_type:complete
MEPQLIDYYNDIPFGINVIDKMNEELSDLQRKYDELYNIHMDYIKIHTEETYPFPKIRVQTFNHLKEYGEKIYHSIPTFTKIIFDFLDHVGWIRDYDGPDHIGKGIMGIKGCGYWDTWENRKLKWDDTTAQDYYGQEIGMTQYSLYLKCKLLKELYILFPEYTNRSRGWFHKIIDDSFDTIGITVGTILEYNCDIPKKDLHNIIYQIIIENLFGWGSDKGDPLYEDDIGIWPADYMNKEYIQNIIYYQCNVCKKIFNGENVVDYDEEMNVVWFQEDGSLCSEPCTCKK